MARRHLIFAVTGLALLMSSVDNTIVAVGLPALQKGLNASLVLIGWTVTSYQLGQLLVLPVAGKLSDELGRKRVFLVSVAIFTLASFFCAAAPNVYVLIIFRIVQAIGGGAFLPSCTGIVSDQFGRNRGQAIGLFSSIFPIGGVIGPNIGGVIIDHLSWRFIFYVNVPIGIAVLLLTWWLYQVKQEKVVRRRIDFAGVALYGTAIVIFLLALSWIGHHANDLGHAPLLWLSLAGAIGLLVIWYRHEKRTAEPMLDLDLVTRGPFLAANTYNFLWGASLFGFTSFLPTYAELRFQMSATEAGAMLTPRNLVMIAMSTIASIYLLRFGYRLPMIIGALFASLSLFLVSTAPLHPTLFGMSIAPVIYLSSVASILGIGFGLSNPASNNASLDLVPGKVAAVTGIRAMFRQTGGTLGTAALVCVVSLFSDTGHGLQVVFFALSFGVLLLIPPVFFIPDIARSRQGDLIAEGGPASAETVLPAGSGPRGGD